MELIHYILVRRDLPFGTTLAMVGHAAADSVEVWARSWFRYKRKHEPITMVILGVEDYKALVKANVKLAIDGLKAIPIVDTFVRDGEEIGPQLLAIGIEPGSREFLSPFFKSYSVYRGKV